MAPEWRAQLTKRLPRSAKEHLTKARESCLAAVAAYNNPTAEFRTGTYIVLMMIAWTSMFHAIFYKRRTKPWQRTEKSGSGKGTVIAHLRKVFPDAVFPLSCTTRSPRPGEKDGEVYHFINKEEFQRRIKAGDILEWAIVHHDNYYGTLKQPILDALKAGKIVIR